MEEKITIESKVARAILQKEEDIEINGIVYSVAPPTTATLIEVSALCSQLPDFSAEGTILSNVILSAGEFVILGKIAALMILGAKRVHEKHFVDTEITEAVKKWSWKQMRFVRVERKVAVKVNEYEHLAGVLLDETPLNELQIIIAQRLADMNIGDFFALTASLKGINLIKPTKEAETQYGE